MLTGDVRWARLDREALHARVYACGEERVVELKAIRVEPMPGMTTWMVAARWRLGGEAKWLEHQWTGLDEKQAMALLDAVGIGIVTVLGAGQLVEVDKIAAPAVLPESSDG